MNQFPDQSQLKCIGYARKSSEDNKERQAASLPEQLYILEGMKSRLKLRIVGILEESKSAHQKGREVFESMLARVEAGGANAIVTWHPNRLARNMTDGGRIIDLMDSGKLIEVITPSRAYLNTPEDKFMLTLEFGLSKKDSDDKAIVVTRGLEKKCRDGWRPGVAPQGYLNDKATESGFRQVLKDPERFEQVKKLLLMFLEGESVNNLHRIAKDEWGYRTNQKKRSGGVPLSISMIYKMLTNPFYCKKFEYPEGSGIWYPGKHEAMITEDQFKQIQVRLGKRGKYTLQNHEYSFTSLIKCGECNSVITAEQKHQAICTKCRYKFSLTKKNKDHCTKCGTRIEEMKKPTILDYTYYRCTRSQRPGCMQKGLRLDKLEEQVDYELSQVEIHPLFAQWALKQIEKMNQDEIKLREDNINNIKRAHDAARAKLDNLLHLKISPANSDGSLLSDEKFREEKLEIETEVKSLENQLANTDQRMLQVAHDINETFEFATLAQQRFAAADLKTKRKMAMDLGTHLILKDKKVLFDNPFPIFKLKEIKKEVPSVAITPAPENYALESTKMEAYWASIPTLLRGRESHPVWKIMSLPCGFTLPRISRNLFIITSEY